MQLDPHTPDVSRRTVLKGLGASLTLPWLESVVWAKEKAGEAADAKPPRRWACVMFGNGVNVDEWSAEETGRGLKLQKTLAPLQPHADDLTVLKGFRLFDQRPRGSVHWPYFTNFLSGQGIDPTPVPDVAESLDHLLARKIGRNTSVPMMVLGCEKPFTGVRSGWPSIYSATVSWSSRRTPIPPETYPRQAFDRLFDTSGLLQDKSVLDAVLEQAKGLRLKLGSHDQAKLDQYLNDVREVERRLQIASSEGRYEGWSPKLTEPNIDRPPADLPRDLPEHMTLMLDIVTLAFQMDKTRVATLLLNNDLSEQRFTFLDGVTTNDIMHNISHHGNKEANLAEYAAINRYHSAKFAYLLQKMKGVEEGEGTLLDHSLVLFGSSMMDGNSHDCTTLPIIVAGGSDGTAKTGRVLDVSDRSDEDRRLCNVHLAALQRMGVDASQFGNSIAPTVL